MKHSVNENDQGFFLFVCLFFFFRKVLAPNKNFDMSNSFHLMNERKLKLNAINTCIIQVLNLKFMHFLNGQFKINYYKLSTLDSNEFGGGLMFYINEGIFC